jgi:asparagine synthase (glutamine-hydrolysing)
LVHRGPDDEGYYINKNVGLAHRRLSIIDISDRGCQPIFNENKTVAIIFNGEIYNFLTLKENLTKDGHIFTTDTDTEVIVHSYEKWGIDFLNKLDGMFSLALYDILTKRIILATDTFGKKPLYYYFKNGIFLFGSEIKAFFKHPDFQAIIRTNSVATYLAYEYVPTPDTIFENCYKLPAASFLILDTRHLHTVPDPIEYWQPIYEPKPELSLDDAIEGLNERLESAVNKRLISDVPLGVFLSGGIDSSSIVSLMRQNPNISKIKTFNIGFCEPSFDESEPARIIAQKFQTDHYEKKLSGSDMLDVLPEIIAQTDEPFADPSIIPTYLLSQFARKNVTVAISGDGGDELFAGYDTFLALGLCNLFKRIPFKIIDVISKFAESIPPTERNMDFQYRLKHFLKGFATKDKKDVETINNRWLGAFTPETMERLFVSKLNNANSPHSIYNATFSHKKKRRAKSQMDRLIDNYISLYLHDDILVKVDRASMLNSLEVRSPFLDKSLAEFVCSLPTKFKMNGLTRKFILKKAIEKRLPKKILKRAKKGFGIPLAKWFNGPLNPLLMDVLSENNLKQTGMFNPSYVKKLIDDQLQRRRDTKKELWCLFVFEYWRQSHGLSI